MANKPNLRLATPILPLQCEIEEINGKQKLKGLKVLTNIVELFEKAGFNVSMFAVDEQTTGIADENGTYNGIYGAVQSGKADTSIIGVPLRIAESIGQLTSVIMDTVSFITTKREPVQVYEGTLYDCFTTLGSMNNLLFGVIVALILILLSLLVSKHASWNFFAQLMTENFVHFRPLSLQITFMAALFMVRALFGSAYSTDVTIANPPKLINSLEDLAKSKFLPIWLEGDPTFLEFKEGVTKAHADVFNMGPKNRKRILPLFDFLLPDYKPYIESNSILHFNELTSSILKYICKFKSYQVCSGGLRIFISEPFSRTAYVYVYSKNSSTLSADALKKYAQKALEQSLYGNTIRTASDDIFAPSPRCENEIFKGVEAVAAANRVHTKLVPWFEMICALIAAMAVFLVEIMFGIMTFLISVRGYFWV